MNYRLSFLVLSAALFLGILFWLFKDTEVLPDSFHSRHSVRVAQKDGPPPSKPLKKNTKIVESQPTTPTPPTLGEYEGFNDLQKIIANDEVSRVLFTSSSLDNSGQFTREYVIKKPSSDFSASIMAKIDSLSGQFTSSESSTLRTKIHDFFDFSKDLKIVKIVYVPQSKGDGWYRNIQVFDTDQVTAIEDAEGNQTSYRPGDAEPPDFKSWKNPARFQMFEELHATADGQAMKLSIADARNRRANFLKNFGNQ